jgi:hypothetical protein
VVVEVGTPGVERNPAMISDITVVVRCAGERTESLCQDVVRAQVTGPVHVVRERPFAAALRTSVQIGIREARSLTLCVDADIVFAPNGVGRMVERMAQDAEAFFTCGYFLDKYYGEPKSRGAHLYRTSLLAEAERAIPAADDVQRPETAMKQVLLDAGHRSLTVEDHVLGLHGYGQYYRDTFRTIACRGQKSPTEFASLMTRFSRHAGRDADLRVALWALVAANDDFSLDAHHWNDKVTQLLDASQLPEKSQLSRTDALALKALARAAGHMPLSAWRQIKSVRAHLGYAS